MEWIEVCREITCSLCRSSVPSMSWSPDAGSALVWVEKREGERRKRRDRRDRRKRRKRRKRTVANRGQQNGAEDGGNGILEIEFQSFVKSLVRDQRIMKHMMDPTVDVDAIPAWGEIQADDDTIAEVI